MSKQSKVILSVRLSERSIEVDADCYDDCYDCQFTDEPCRETFTIVTWRCALECRCWVEREYSEAPGYPEGMPASLTIECENPDCGKKTEEQFKKEKQEAIKKAEQIEL